MAVKGIELQGRQFPAQQSIDLKANQNIMNKMGVKILHGCHQ